MRYLVLGCLAVMCFAVCGPPLGDEELPLTPTPTPLRREREHTITVNNLKLSDGTKVHFMLGLVGCGVMELGKGEAIVKDGRFELPFDLSDPQWNGRSVDLFIKVGDSWCDLNDEVLRLADVSPAPGSVVDASSAESTSIGCWLFDAERI